MMNAIKEAVTVANASEEKINLMKLVAVFEKFNMVFVCSDIFGFDNKNYFIVNRDEIMIGNTEMSFALPVKVVKAVSDLDDETKSYIQKFDLSDLENMRVYPERHTSAMLKRDAWLDDFAF